eukprot:758184-Hanusia_phi.AAC.15
MSGIVDQSFFDGTMRKPETLDVPDGLPEVATLLKKIAAWNVHEGLLLQLQPKIDQHRMAIIESTVSPNV